MKRIAFSRYYLHNEAITEQRWNDSNGHRVPAATDNLCMKSAFYAAMEPPPKQQRLDEPRPHFQNGWSGDALNTGPFSQSTSHFNGSGISNPHGDLRVGRDINIISNHGAHSQPIDTRRALLESLKFDQIDTRRQTIKNAHPNTCQWFLQTEPYKQWDSRESSLQNKFLWIKGKPGAGKSTLMKFLHRHISKQISKDARNEVLLSFFFNARGQELEKSIDGLYRSLLKQLFDMKPALQSVLDSFSPGHVWTVESLTSVLEEALQDLENTPIICLIDALDECDEEQVRDMVSFLERLTFDHTSLHICFASRHYPHINVQTELSIVLEERKGHEEDITTYLKSALRIGHTDRAEKIHSRLQEKARGVFIWVTLVVSILNKDYGTGDVLELEDRIEELPGDLYSLFSDILTRNTQNRKELKLCIQWLLFGQYSLTPLELYTAILAGSTPEKLSKWRPDEFQEADAERYILDKSKGLTELTKSKRPTVQFIHESVLDFLGKGDGLIWLFPDLETNAIGDSHNALKACCVAYMSFVAEHLAAKSSKRLSPPPPIAEVNTMGRIWSPQPKRSDAPDRQSVIFEFLEYANSGILYHADRAEKYGSKQCDFLAKFPLSEWVRQNGVLEEIHKPWHTTKVSLLHILVESGHSALVRAYVNCVLGLDLSVTETLSSSHHETEKAESSCACNAGVEGNENV